ncbi:hypothetical protein ACFL1Y_01450 [Patescibacteria group bacterium]
MPNKQEFSILHVVTVTLPEDDGQQTNIVSITIVLNAQVLPDEKVKVIEQAFEKALEQFDEINQRLFINLANSYLWEVGKDQLSLGEFMQEVFDKLNDNQNLLLLKDQYLASYEVFIEQPGVRFSKKLK